MDLVNKQENTIHVQKYVYEILNWRQLSEKTLHEIIHLHPEEILIILQSYNQMFAYFEDFIEKTS